MKEKDYAYALVALQYAKAIQCVRCLQVFSQVDKVTKCPNSSNGSHALVPYDA